MKLGTFLLRLLAFTALLAIILHFAFVKPERLSPAIWGVVGFFAALSLILYILSLRSLRMSVKNSMSIILGTLVFRLFASLAYLVTYVMVTGNRDPLFIGTFLILYLLFTVFEIYHLVANLRPDSKK